MLTSREATQDLDRRIAIGLAQWTGDELVEQPFTRDLDAASGLRRWMESDGRSGKIRPVTLDDRAAFFYSCHGERGEPFAQGVGDSPALAICDAFLHCCPDMP
ncbi:MAG: hypothetical protein ABI592_07360 [Acidobacteriota bacterium]